MAKQKLYAGTKLRELRRKVDLTQREFSERLEVSLPYLNQMENNNRPVSAAVILALADVFGFDVTELVSGDNARLVSDMREAATDPIFGADAPHLADIRMAANNAPGLARASCSCIGPIGKPMSGSRLWMRPSAAPTAAYNPALGKRFETFSTIVTTILMPWTAQRSASPLTPKAASRPMRLPGLKPMA